MSLYSGYLYLSLRGEDVLPRELVLSAPEIVATTKENGWEGYKLITNSAIPGIKLDGDTFEYNFIVRRSGKRSVSDFHKAIILAEHKKAVDVIIGDYIYKSHLFPIRKATIHVDDVISYLQEMKSYRVCFVHGRMKIQTQKIRSVSFYGEDVGTGDLFSDCKGNMNCFTFGLGRNALLDPDAAGGVLVSDASEIVRLSVDGSVSSYLDRMDNRKDIECVMAMLFDRGFVS